MPRIRSIFISMFVVGAVSIAIVPAASAQFRWAHIRECRVKTFFRQPEKFLTKENCEGQVVLEPTGEWEHEEQLRRIGGRNVGVQELETEIAKTKVTVSCSEAKVEGKAEEEGKGKATITYEKCEVKGASACKVPNITAKVLYRFEENETAKEDELKFSEEEGKGFTTVVIETCVLKGTYKVKGTQNCALPKGEEFAVTHEIECKPSGSKLEFEKSKATYTGTVTSEASEAPKEEWAVE